MQIRAQQKNIKISSRKLRLVADLVRGLEFSQAKEQLINLSKKGAGFVLKTLESAAANARHNHQLSDNNLYISQIMVSEARVLKRWQPVSMGRAHPILKRYSHLKIVLSDMGESGSKKDSLLTKIKSARPKPLPKRKSGQKLDQVVSTFPRKIKAVSVGTVKTIFDPRPFSGMVAKEDLANITSRAS